MRKTKIAYPKTFEGPARLNCPDVVSTSQGKWMIYRIPVLGCRPIRFSSQLPKGLTLMRSRALFPAAWTMRENI